MADVADQISSTGQIPPVSADALKQPPAAVAWHDKDPMSTPGLGASPGLNPVQQGMGSDLDKQIMSLIPKMAAARQQQAAVNKTSAQDEEKQAAAYRQSIKALYEANKPKDFNPSAPPKQPEDNPLKQFGSLASMLGIFASAFTKKPIMNALNASAAAMTAQREGDVDAYGRAYKEWQDQIDIALKKNKADYEKLHELLELSSTDNVAFVAELKAHAAAAGSDAAAAVAEMGDTVELGKLAGSLQTAQTKMEENRIRMGELLQKQHTGMIKEQVFEDTLKANLAAGMPPALAEANALKASEGKDSGRGVSAANVDKTYTDKLTEYKANGIPDEQAQDKAIQDAISGFGTTVPYAALKKAAKLYNQTGNLSSAAPGFGKDNANRDAVEAIAAMLEPNADLAGRHANFVGQQQEERTKAAIAGRIEFASKAVDNQIPVVRKAMSGVDMSKFTDFNSFENYFRSHSSDRGLAGLATALQGMESDYTGLLVRAGVPTDAAREKAHGLINTAMGEGSMSGFLEYVKREEKAQLRATYESTGRDKPADYDTYNPNAAVDTDEDTESRSEDSTPAPDGIDPALWDHLTPDEQQKFMDLQ